MKIPEGFRMPEAFQTLERFNLLNYKDLCTN